MSQIIQIGDFEINPIKENLLECGAYGEVFRCQNLKSQEEYCVRIVRKDIYSDKINSAVDETIKRFRQIQDVHCENLVQFQGVYEVIDVFYIIMEYCNYDLKQEFQMLKRQKTWYTEKEQIELIHQIVKGFQCLFEMNLIPIQSRELEILVKIINKNGVKPQKVYKINYPNVQESLESMFHRDETNNFIMNKSPQVIFETNFTGKCDIFSLGLIFYQLTHLGNHPWGSKSKTGHRNFIFSMQTTPFKCQISEGKHKNELSNLIERMLAYHEEDRIDFIEIFNHPVMKINYLNDEIIQTTLVYFYRKFLFVEQIVKQLRVVDSQNSNINLIIFYLFQFGLIQLNYALGIMHLIIVDIHDCFKQNNDLLQLIEILEKSQFYAEQNTNKIKQIITEEYFKWRKQYYQLQYALPSDFKEKAFRQNVDAKQICQSLALLTQMNLGLPLQLQSQLKKASNLESLYPVQNYFKMNTEELWKIQQLIIQ